MSYNQSITTLDFVINKSPYNIVHLILFIRIRSYLSRHLFTMRISYWGRSWHISSPYFHITCLIPTCHAFFQKNILIWLGDILFIAEYVIFSCPDSYMNIFLQKDFILSKDMSTYLSIGYPHRERNPDRYRHIPIKTCNYKTYILL